MGCIGPIRSRPTAFGSKNIGDGIYAPNAPRCSLCGLDELFTAVRPRNDLDGIGVRQSYHDPGVAWSNHHVLRFRAEHGPDETPEGFRSGCRLVKSPRSSFPG